tara:strand:- start:2670 stop:3767 length:1098 start_codon:yes stop_codon:yes gene_type:complete
MEVRFSPIVNISDPAFLLSILELYAFTRGEALFSDLDIDFDTVLQDVEDEPEKFGLDTEADILRDEPAAARQLVEDLVKNSIFELAEERENKFGRNYAFERVPGAPTTLRIKAVADVSAAGFATAWLSFFHAIDAEGFLNMPSREVRALRMLYAKVFELVALLATTSIGPSVGWWTGRSWSEEAKLNNFQRLVDIVGYGKVKAPHDWEELEKQAKDAGADAFLVTTIGGMVTSGSVCIALGATIQRKQRQKKKIGKDGRDRLLSFYLHRPTVPLIGAAADPYPFEDVLAQDYSKADCLYLHGDVLWNLLRTYSPQSFSKPLSDLMLAIENDLKSEMKEVLKDAKIKISGMSFELAEAFKAYVPAA